MHYVLISKIGYIYKICCNDAIVKDFYIGSTANIKERKRCHKKACNNENNKDHYCKLYKCIRKNGGFENWNIIVIKQV